MKQKRLFKKLFCMAVIVCVACVGGIMTAHAMDYMIPTPDGEDSVYVYLSDSEPHDLTVEAITESTVTLSWSDYDYGYEEYEEGYEVFLCNADGSYTLLGTTNETGYTVTNLAPATTYRFAVRKYAVALDVKCDGILCEPCTISTTPKAVKLKSVKYVSKGKIKVTWQKSAKAVGYAVQYSTGKKFDARTTNTVLVKGAGKTSTTISALAKKQYYVRVAPYAANDINKYCAPWSNTKSVKVKQGVSLKTMINHTKTDLSGRKAIKALTKNGVDIKKYKTTYDRVQAIYFWHAKHGLEFEHCLACNANFNDCIDALYGNKKAYDSFIWIAAGAFKNKSGSESIHKWSVLYYQGVPYIFDPRLQSYTKDYKGTMYFGIPKSNALTKRYLFDGWYIYWRNGHTAENSILYYE